VDPPRNPGNWRAASEAAERRALAEDYTASYPPWVQRYLAGEDASARCGAPNPDPCGLNPHGGSTRPACASARCPRCVSLAVALNLCLHLTPPATPPALQPILFLKSDVLLA